jgi:hypothetical protein
MQEILSKVYFKLTLFTAKSPAIRGAFLSSLKSNYLVGDGFAVLDVDVVLAVFIGFAVFDVPAVLLIVDVVFVVVAVFVAIVDAVFVVLAVFAGLLALALFAVSPPQAIPKALRPKSAESAIAFFMLKTFSCLLQRLI